MNKAILLLVIISAVFAKDEFVVKSDIEEYIEMIKCFLNQKALMDEVNEAFEALKTLDFPQLVIVAMKIYPEAIKAYKECYPKMWNIVEGEATNINCYRRCVAKWGEEESAKCDEKCRIRFIK